MPHHRHVAAEFSHIEDCVIGDRYGNPVRRDGQQQPCAYCEICGCVPTSIVGYEDGNPADICADIPMVKAVDCFHIYKTHTPLPKVDWIELTLVRRALRARMGDALRSLAGWIDGRGRW